jgi:hypothetical protein
MKRIVNGFEVEWASGRVFAEQQTAFVMGRAEEYWRYARQCLEIAPAFKDEEARATLLDLARAWLRLTRLAQATSPIWRSRSLASV